MDKNVFALIQKSFWISLAYVGLGTITVLSIYPSSPIYGDWVVISLLITLPVTFISVGIMYSDATAHESVLVVQLIVFLVFWLILYTIMKKRAGKKNQTPPVVE